INIPLVRFINTDWYHTLVDTVPGQMVIAVCIAAVFVSFAFVVKLTQPIEYRRCGNGRTFISVRDRAGRRTVFRPRRPSEDSQTGHGTGAHFRRTAGAEPGQSSGGADPRLGTEAGAADPNGRIQIPPAGEQAHGGRVGYDAPGLHGLFDPEALPHPARHHPVPADP